MCRNLGMSLPSVNATFKWITAASAGRWACGILTNGSLWCWGSLPALNLALLNTQTLVRVSMGANVVCVLRLDARIQCVNVAGNHPRTNCVLFE